MSDDDLAAGQTIVYPPLAYAPVASLAGKRNLKRLFCRSRTVPLRKHATRLEALYRELNRPEFIDPDPLLFVRRYEDPADREVVGLIASSLAYGRVQQILRSVQLVLDRMGQSPAAFARDASRSRLERSFSDFRHRFDTGIGVASLIRGIGVVIRQDRSLERSFAMSLHQADIEDPCAQGSLLPGLRRWVGRLQDAAGWRCGFLLSDPGKGGACKRLHLYLRWMVRRDAVDVGQWRCVQPARLIVPLDVHMHRMAKALGATARNVADAKAALEVTAAFAAIAPDDPVKYDFPLTRLGIHPRFTPQQWLDGLSK